MRRNSLVLTLGLALATTYGLAQQTGSQAGQTGQYPSSQSPSTQQEPSTQQMPPANSPDQGQASTAPGQNQAAQVSDDALQREVQDKLATEPALKGIQVEAKKGVVTLNGSVPSKADRKQAKELAKSVPGVRKVHEKLKVEPNAGATTSGAANTPVPSTAGSEAGNTSAQAGVAQGNQEPGSMTSSTQPRTGQQGAEAQEGTQSSSSSSAQSGMTPQSSQNPNAGQAESGQQGAANPSAGSAGTTDNQMGTASNNEQVRSQIENALQQAAAGGNVAVNVTDSEIDLSGTVATSNEKQTAERIASSYAGNRRIVDNIKVTQSSGQMNPNENPQEMPPASSPGASQPSTAPEQGSNPNTVPQQTPPQSNPQQQPPMTETPPPQL